MLYYAIFSPNPPDQAETVAASLIKGNSREELALIVDEIRQELDEPTQQLRDIFDLPHSEEQLREYLRAVAQHLEAAFEPD